MKKTVNYLLENIISHNVSVSSMSHAITVVLVGQ